MIHPTNSFVWANPIPPQHFRVPSAEEGIFHEDPSEDTASPHFDPILVVCCQHQYLSEILKAPLLSWYHHHQRTPWLWPSASFVVRLFCCGHCC